MKTNRWLQFNRIMLMLVALFALSVLVSARPALADGMVVSPAEGNYSSTFSVAADGFAAGESVIVAARFLDGSGVGMPETTADESGHISFTINPYGEWPDGTVTVVVQGSHSHNRYTATFHLVHNTVEVSSSDWTGEYYNNMNLSNDAVLVRHDAALLFNWGGGSPDSAVQADNFSARWTTTRTVEAGDYTIVATADDGVRVWVDDQLVIDQWKDQPATTYSTTVYLGAGQHTLRVEYYENMYDALISVELVQQ